jgi:nucleoside-diphosphate-sugar epimerase
LRAGVGAFVYTSTTSAFGDALVAPDGAAAAWITEDVAPVPKNIYGWRDAYARLGWRMAERIDRVYDSARARADLGWRPRHDFAAVLARARDEGDVRSPLARTIGAKGYHRAAP